MKNRSIAMHTKGILIILSIILVFLNGKGYGQVRVRTHEPRPQVAPRAHIIAYTMELNSVDPGKYDPANDVWIQPYPMPQMAPGVNKVTIKYTLINKINIKPGSFKGDINGNALLTPPAKSNKTVALPVGANFSGEFYCNSLPPGNYKLHLYYITQAVGFSAQTHKVYLYDSTAAVGVFDYTVAAPHIVDNDNDGIDDMEEDRLLEKFRPYYKFSKQYENADDYRPADVEWFIKQSELLTSEQESESPIIANNILAINPSAIIFNSADGKGSDIKYNPKLTGYHVNPLNNGPGRNGAAWAEVTLKKNVGMYGHVVPIKLVTKGDGSLD